MLEKQKTLKNELITLRKLKLSDSEALHEMLADKVLVDKAGLLLHSHISETMNFILERNDLVKRNQEYLYGIFNDEVLVGIINLFNVDYLDKSGEFGYFIGQKYQRKGYMQSAIKLLSNYLLANSGIEKIYVYIDVDNLASINLIKKFNIKQVDTSIEEDLSHKIVQMHKYVINEKF